jgi:hypothetical protein
MEEILSIHKEKEPGGSAGSNENKTASNTHSPLFPDLPLAHVHEYPLWKAKVQRVFLDVTGGDESALFDDAWPQYLTGWLLKQLPEHFVRPINSHWRNYPGISPWYRLDGWISKCPICSGVRWEHATGQPRTLKYVLIAAKFGCENCSLAADVLRDFSSQVACRPHEEIQFRNRPEGLRNDFVFTVSHRASEEAEESFWVSRVPSELRAF